MSTSTVEARLYDASVFWSAAPGQASLTRHGHVGLALSGGGSRSAAACLGTLRCLDALGLLADVRVLSCVSGATWYAVPFTFLPEDFDEAAFLGPRVAAPETLRWSHGDAPTDVCTLGPGHGGQGLTRLSMGSVHLLLQSLKEAAHQVPHHRIWSKEIAEYILQPFGLAAFDDQHLPIDWFAPDAATAAAVRATSPGLPARYYTVRASTRMPRPQLMVNLCLKVVGADGQERLAPVY